MKIDRIKLYFYLKKVGTKMTVEQLIEELSNFNLDDIVMVEGEFGRRMVSFSYDEEDEQVIL